MQPMKNWNVVVSIYQDGFRQAIRALREIGSVECSPYHNVLVMTAENPVAMLDAIEKETEERPYLFDTISRVAPAMSSFEFHSAEEFRDRAKALMLEWSPKLAGRTFHVRFHRRGSTHTLPSPDIERLLDDTLLDALRQAGASGVISFTDPDAVIAIDTIDDRAGLALWTREDIAHHRLLRPD
jgi:tRNA(Ser,Leu) C12 N-acetylase TAN1